MIKYISPRGLARFGIGSVVAIRKCERDRLVGQRFKLVWYVVMLKDDANVASTSEVCERMARVGPVTLGRLVHRFAEYQSCES